MEKQYLNFSAQTVVKRQGGSGTLKILEFKKPTALQEGLAFFIEIETSDKENERIVKILSEELKEQFFSAPTDSVEFAFENALSRANIAIKDTLLIKPKNWLSKIHVAVLANKDQEVHLASVGMPHAFLVHRDQIVDVLAGEAKNNGRALDRGFGARTPNPVKLFSNIVSGRLLPNDALVIVNESVLDYLSPERIRKTAQDFDPEAAVAKLSELLSAAPANKQFGVIIVKRLPLERPAQAPQPKPVLEKIQKQVLAPAPEVKKVKFFSSAVKKFCWSLMNALGQWGQTGFGWLLDNLSRLLERALLLLRAVLPRLSKAPAFLLTLTRDQAARNYHWSKTKNYFSQKQAGLNAYFKNLPRRQKRIFTAIAVLTLLLAASVAARGYDKSQTEKDAARQRETAALSQEIDQSEAAILYNDQARARELLLEASKKLAALKKGESQDGKTYQTLEQKIADLENRLEKKTVLEKLEIFVSLDSAPSENSGLLLSGDTLVFYDGNAGELVKINKESRERTKIAALAGEGRFKSAAAIDDKTVALLSEAGANLVNVNNEKIAGRGFIFPPDQKTAFVGYAGNLYAFSAADKTIIRYREGFFDKAEFWLKQNYDLAQAADIAVDGQVYVLSRDGKIHVFGSGYLANVIDLKLTTPLGPNPELYINEDLANFYVLDGANSRSLRFSRQGEFLGQTVSPSLDEARAMVVGKGETEAFVLKADKIYRLPLTSG